MPALVESMMYVREKPWHGLGTRVEEAPTSTDALRMAGLDWSVVQRNIQVCGGAKIKNYKANIRDSDGTVLGVVSDRYKIVQNAEAFEFTDSLIGGEVRYETAGSLNGGRKIWLLAKLPETEIVGDKTEPYLCFSNTHDGSGAIRVCMTPIRVVCNNTLNLALDTAKRAWSVRHTGDMQSKMYEARACLEMASAYTGSTFMPPLYGLLGRLLGFDILPFFLAALVILTIVMIELTFRSAAKNKSIKKSEAGRDIQ